MATTIKKVTLKSLGKNKDIDPSKGTVTNPFTQEEYNSLCNTGEWPGGYVEAMGYVAPPMMDGGDDGSGSGSGDIEDDDRLYRPYIGILVSNGSKTVNDEIPFLSDLQSASNMPMNVVVSWSEGRTGAMYGNESVISFGNVNYEETELQTDQGIVLHTQSTQPTASNGEWYKTSKNHYEIHFKINYSWEFKEKDHLSLNQYGQVLYDGNLLSYQSIPLTKKNDSDQVDLTLNDDAFIKK